MVRWAKVAIFYIVVNRKKPKLEQDRKNLLNLLKERLNYKLPLYPGINGY
jgi:hypothetical protein